MRAEAQQATVESAAREAGLKATVDQMRQQIEALQAESVRDRKQIKDLITRLGRAEGDLEASRINIPTKRQSKADFVRHAVPNASDEPRPAAIALGEPNPWTSDSEAARPSARQGLGAKPPTPASCGAKAKSVRRAKRAERWTA